MDRLTEMVLTLRLALESVHPGLPGVAMALAAWCFVYVLRTWTPGLWLWFEGLGPKAAGFSNAFQALPSALFGAVFGALGAGDDPTIAALGVLYATCAPALHHGLKILPFVKYTGAVNTALADKLSKTTSFFLCLLCVGCGASQAYEVCSAKTRAEFHLAAEDCDDEACIDALSAKEAAALKECPQ